MDSDLRGLVLSSLPLAADLFLSSAFTDDLVHERKTVREADEVDECVGIFAAGGSTTQVKKRILGVVDTTIPESTDLEDFQRQFHLRRSTVEVILQEFGPQLKKSSTLGRPACPLLTSVLLPVWTLANRENFRQISKRFSVGEGHAYAMFTTFCNVVSSVSGKFIQWPQGEEMQRNCNEFDNLCENAFPGVVGCIDGTYIPVKGRKYNKESYSTKEGFRAIILQGICNAKLQFIDIFVGWPGSADDASVWQNSPICKRLERDATSLISQNKHLLGDAAYPLSNELLIPYRNNGILTAAQNHFNQKLNSSRGVIEDAFALLKSRFRRLQYLDMIRLDRAGKIVTTSCVLHNMCLRDNDTLDQEDISVDEHLIPTDQNLIANTDYSMAKRDSICERLYQNK